MHTSNGLFLLLTEGTIPLGLSCNMAITKVSHINLEKRLELLLHCINLKCVEHVFFVNLWLISWSRYNQSVVINWACTQSFNFQSKCKGFRRSGTAPRPMPLPQPKEKNVHGHVARSRRWFFCHEPYPWREVEGGQLKRASNSSYLVHAKDYGTIIFYRQFRLPTYLIRSTGDVFQYLNDIASQPAS